jgi:20S proteasome alpha/beta subunit
MVGKNCFAIASDRRLGVQLQTIATDFQRIYKIHDRLFVGLSGLATDAQTLYESLRSLLLISLFALPLQLHFFFIWFMIDYL